MTDANVIKITDDNGEVVEAYAITILRNPSNDKRYLLYTFDNDKEDVDIYAAIITNDADTYTLTNIKEDADWNIVQAAIYNLTGE